MLQGALGQNNDSILFSTKGNTSPPPLISATNCPVPAFIQPQRANPFLALVTCLMESV